MMECHDGFCCEKNKKKNKIGRLAQMKNDRSLTNPLNTEVSLIWKIGVLGYKTVQSHIYKRWRIALEKRRRGWKQGFWNILVCPILSRLPGSQKRWLKRRKKTRCCVSTFSDSAGQKLWHQSPKLYLGR